MSTHNICFHGEIRKIFTWYPPISRPMFEHQCQQYLRICAPSEDSDQPVWIWSRRHLHSLIRIFTGCILDSQGCKVPPSRQQWLWSDCTVYADLYLWWAHMPEDTFLARRDYVLGELMLLPRHWRRRLSASASALAQCLSFQMCS